MVRFRIEGIRVLFGGTHHIGGCEVVQQVRNTTSTGCCDCNIQNSLGTCIGFFKGEVADVGADAFLEDIYIEEVALAEVAASSAKESLHET